MMKRTRFMHGWRLLAVAAAAHGCAQPQPSPAGECVARILVGFKGATEAAAVATIAADNGVQLTVVNRLLPDLYVLDLRARGDDAACSAALEHLRGDARVRAVDPDARRAPNRN